MIDSCANRPVEAGFRIGMLRQCRRDEEEKKTLQALSCWS